MNRRIIDSIMLKNLKPKRWFRIAIYIIILAGISVGFVYLLRYFISNFDISSSGLATTVYLVVFVVSLISNASIIFPVAIHLPLMVAASSEFNFVIIALIASTAGTLGEITGYYAGYLGKKIIVTDKTPGYTRLVNWMTRHGPLAVFILSLQPIIPFDIAGLISGASKIPLWKFLLPCWAGKSLKYLLICYFGSAILDLIPL